MSDLLKNGKLLDDDILAGVSGGMAEEGTASVKLCPVCKKPVGFSRVTRYDGGDLTLYKCASCAREFSLNQINRQESLGTNYTGLGDDKFGL